LTIRDETRAIAYKWIISWSSGRRRGYWEGRRIYEGFAEGSLVKRGPASSEDLRTRGI
jgi:hypothetical protein